MLWTSKEVHNSFLTWPLGEKKVSKFSHFYKYVNKRSKRSTHPPFTIDKTCHWRVLVSTTENQSCWMSFLPISWLDGHRASSFVHTSFFLFFSLSLEWISWWTSIQVSLSLFVSESWYNHDMTHPDQTIFKEKLFLWNGSYLLHTRRVCSPFTHTQSGSSRSAGVQHPSSQLLTLVSLPHRSVMMMLLLLIFISFRFAFFADWCCQRMMMLLTLVAGQIMQNRACLLFLPLLAKSQLCVVFTKTKIRVNVPRSWEWYEDWWCWHREQCVRFVQILTNLSLRSGIVCLF